MIRKISFASAVVVGILGLLAAACASPTPAPRPEFASDCYATDAPRVEAWPEAAALFLGDPVWAGSDGAYSIDLGDERILWLFGDTLIWDAEQKTRGGAGIYNSIGIQTGKNPTTAEIEFFFGEKRGEQAGERGPFFENQGKYFFWPGDGERVGEVLIVFLMRTFVDPSNPFGVTVDHWNAVAIANPDDDPGLWRIQRIGAPENPWGIIVGSASVFVHGDHLYAFGADFDAPNPGYVVRWPLSEVESLDLGQPRWWDGARWTPQDQLTDRPPPIFPDAQMEYTVHDDAAVRRWVSVQAAGLAIDETSRLTMQAGDAVEGAWTAAQNIYYPPEATRPDAWIYAGKAHPELDGPGLVLTYIANATNYATLSEDHSLYYPRFAVLHWRRAEASQCARP